MIIGGMHKLSLIDYPQKLAAIVFTQGCPFRCHYCHNPDLVLPEKYTAPVPESDVLNFLNRRIGKLDAVVISGGEPTMQPDLPLFIKKIKDLGFLVKLDTSGINPKELSFLVNAKLLDYIAMDYKGPIKKYPQIVGRNVDTEKIRQSIDIILSSSVPHEFRTTLVKEIHSFEDVIEIVKSIGGADLFAMQKFVSSVTLNPQFISCSALEDRVLEELKKEAVKYVKHCIIR